MTPPETVPVTGIMTGLVRTKNCGIAEIDYLSVSASPLAALQTLAPALKHGITWPYVNGTRKGCYFPFITFTGVVGNPRTPRFPKNKNYGQAFADYLTEHNLGAVVTLPGRRNWTENMIQIWIWCPDYDAIWALLARSVEEPVLAAPGLAESTTAAEVPEVMNGT